MAYQLRISFILGVLMRFSRSPLLGFLFLLVSVPLIGQQAATTDTQAMLLLRRILVVLTGGMSISDVTLSGTVRRIAGSDDETGTAVLKALATGDARMDLDLPSGPRSEIRTFSHNCPVGGRWSGPDGVHHAISNHNLLTVSSWFFPAFTVSRLISPGTFVVSHVGHETWNGLAVEHLMAYQPSTFQAPTGMPSFSHLSQMDLYLDSGTLLPVALTFNAHPDNDMGLDIPIEIRFSDYRTVNGAQVPFHVQKFLNNSLTLDLQFQSATFNTGLTAAFSIQ